MSNKNGNFWFLLLILEVVVAAAGLYWLHVSLQPGEPVVGESIQPVQPAVRHSSTPNWLLAADEAAFFDPRRFWLPTRPQQGSATLWSEVLPSGSTILSPKVKRYDPKEDIQRLRPTYDNEGIELIGNVTTKNHDYVKMASYDPLQEKIAQWRADGEVDHLRLWTEAIRYTNYIENVGLTKTEATQIAEKAKGQAVNEVNMSLSSLEKGEDGDSYMYKLCLRFAITAVDLNRPAEKILALFAEHERRELVRRNAHYKEGLDQYYETKDPKHLFCIGFSDVSPALLGITEEELGRLRSIHDNWELEERNKWSQKK